MRVQLKELKFFSWGNVLLRTYRLHLDALLDKSTKTQAGRMHSMCM